MRPHVARHAWASGVMLVALFLPFRFASLQAATPQTPADTGASLFRLRAREPTAPFSLPGYPGVPILFIAVYLVLFAWTALGQSQSVLVALGVLGAAYGLSWTVRTNDRASVVEPIL